MKKLQPVVPFLVFLIITGSFFHQTLLNGRLPIPADTIVGLYHPYRDFYAKEYPNGIPYKNFLITDPIRQQYPWRVLSIEQIQSGEIPLWNPYSMGGVPHLANIQTASLYPLNLLLFFTPFHIGWSVLIFLQPVLAGLFLYLYLRNLRLHIIASLMGGIAYSLSGFVIAWLEWGTVIHAALWMPLLLLSIDKIFTHDTKKKKHRYLFIWGGIFSLAYVSAFFAGHLQVFFYLFLTVLAYTVYRFVYTQKKRVGVVTISIATLIGLLLTAVQWVSMYSLIMHSARAIDQADWQKEGWFIPWQHLIQFIAPDFFGNPATLNYWGVWNYAEFVGYIGIIPLIFALFAIIYRQGKEVIFYTCLLILSLVFSLPTIFGKLPYIFQLPFISTSQPTRLLFLIDFSLAVLAAFGCNYYLANKKQWYFPVGILGVILVVLWVTILLSGAGISPEHAAIAKRNLIIPSIIFFLTVVIFSGIIFLKSKKLASIAILLLLIITVFDLLRFATKFTPFTEKAYLYPTTKTITFLKENVGNSRIMTNDSRILPPNFSIIHKIQSVDGYDPLYLKQYGELIASSESGSGIVPTKLGFNRIITPHRIDSRIMDLMGVKYVLSLNTIESESLALVHEEGQTKVYENLKVYPRTFFVEEVRKVERKALALQLIHNNTINLLQTAVVEEKNGDIKRVFTKGNAEIIDYSENRVKIKTSNKDTGFLVLTDTYYPTWKARIYTKNNKPVETKIYRTDYNFRGVVVPAGENIVEFYTTIL